MGTLLSTHCTLLIGTLLKTHGTLLITHGTLRTAAGRHDTISVVGMRVRIWPHVTPLAMAVSFVHAVDGMAVPMVIVHSAIVARSHQW
jgi:hypothetical protein